MSFLVRLKISVSQDLKESSNSVKQDVIYSQVKYQEEMTNLGTDY